jgi:hypothetical protein
MNKPPLPITIAEKPNDGQRGRHLDCPSALLELFAQYRQEPRTIGKRRELDMRYELVHPILHDQPRRVIDRARGVLPLPGPHALMLSRVASRIPASEQSDRYCIAERF